MVEKFLIIVNGSVVISFVRAFNGLIGSGEISFNVPSNPRKILFLNQVTPLFSVFSVIKDSPDWILVANNQLLCSDRQSIANIFIWDAGVRTGDSFNSNGVQERIPVNVLSPTPFFYSAKGRNSLLPSALAVGIQNFEFTQCSSDSVKLK